ncbi:MAG: transcription elongation factor GreA [Clostridia bacterium]|nr:transcription elongation factor GreA [Clostridia bacterium]
MPQNNEVMMTYEGLKKLEEELEYLKTEKRKEISERIKIALGYGDLSENSEYDEAKTEQAQVELKILELENTLRNAKVIDEEEVDNKIVQVGNKVKVHDMEFDEDAEYIIVGPTEVNLAEGKISNESPIGKALLGKKRNEIAEAVLDNGDTIKLKILKISFGL